MVEGFRLARVPTYPFIWVLPFIGVAMSNFSYAPSPTAGMVRCKTCGVQKPRSEFPVVDHGLRIGCHCNKCQEWITKDITSRVDVASLSYSAGTKALMNGKLK